MCAKSWENCPSSTPSTPSPKVGQKLGSQSFVLPRGERVNKGGNEPSGIGQEENVSTRAETNHRALAKRRTCQQGRKRTIGHWPSMKLEFAADKHKRYTKIPQTRTSYPPTITVKLSKAQERSPIAHNYQNDSSPVIQQRPALERSR
jgi:hypothetical protein